jgi:hypothetical protein
MHAGGVEYCGSHGWRDDRVSGFRAAAKTLVIAGDLHDFDLGCFLHGQNLVATPIRASHLAAVEGDFFLECLAQAHNDATLQATIELARVDDLAWVNADGEFSDA